MRQEGWVRATTDVGSLSLSVCVLVLGSTADGGFGDGWSARGGGLGSGGGAIEGGEKADDRRCGYGASEVEKDLADGGPGESEV
ncbi:hypothetical protein CDV36_014952, partial [Fusarium kuroshium]